MNDKTNIGRRPQACVGVIASLGALLAIVAVRLYAAPLETGDRPANASTVNASSGVGPPVPGAPPFLAGIAVDHEDGIYREGDLLHLKCKAERDAYLYVLYRQANGETALIFPNGLQRNNRMKGNVPVVLPPLDGEVVYRVRPPLGDELLQVVASLKPLSELSDLVRDGSRAVVVSQATSAALQQHLQQERGTWTEHRLPIRTVPKSSDRPRPAKRVGLFIGLAEYAVPKVCAPHVELGNSATVLHDLMLKHGRLDPQGVRLLRDKQATKAEIHRAITEWLPSVSQPGDTVFLYFSGHAGQFATEDPSETDGHDEALCPYDISIGSDGMSSDQRLETLRRSNILDDELAYWLQGLSGRQVVFILDTCHGGGVVESKGLVDGLAVETQRVKDISQLNVTVLSSCAADEQSLFEGTKNQTMWFTYCLTEAIANRKPQAPLTVADAFGYSKQRMKQLVEQGNSPRDQEPVLVDRTLLPIVLIP